MAKGQKKISVNAFEKVAKTTALPVVIEQWFGNELIINPTLSLTEMLTFVNDVVNSCFDDQGDYVPEILDFVIGCSILEKYANFSLPKNLESRYELIYNTNAVDTVYSHINQVQFKVIRSAIDKKIKYMCDTNSIYIRRSFEAIVKSLSAIQEKSDGIFDGVEANDVERLVDALGNANNFDVSKIVEAYLEHTNSEKQPGEE